MVWQRRGGGIPRLAGFHIGLYFLKVPPVNPSVKNQRFLPAPFSKGAFLRPVSFHCAIPDFFHLSIDSVGTKCPKNTQPKTGAEAKTPHPSQSEGSIPRWFHPGDSQGGNNSSGSELSPLKPDNFPYFLAGARKYGPAGKRPECLRCQFRWVADAGRHFPDPPGIVTAVEVGVLITFIKYRPQSKPLAYPPLAPSVTCGDSSLPEGAIGFCLFT